MLKFITMISKQEWLIILQNMWDKCWGERYLLNISTTAEPRYLVKDPSQENQIVSEGMSFGMLLCVALSKLFPRRVQEFEAVFFGLVKGLSVFGSDVLPSWKVVKKDEAYEVPPDQRATAADADIVIAWSLLEAEQLVRKRIWKNAECINCGALALAMLAEIKKTEIKKIPHNWGSYLFLKPSREWGGLKLISETVWNPSYVWFPAFTLFAKHDRKNKTFWKKLIRDSEKAYQKMIDERNLIFDWGKVMVSKAGKISFSSLGQGMSFNQTFDGVRGLFILGIMKNKNLCKKLLKNKKAEEYIITPDKPSKALALAGLLALAYGAHNRKQIKLITELLIDNYNWELGFFGDSRDRYYNNTLIMLLISKIILGA